MFPCFSNNGNDPIFYNDHGAYDRPFYIDTIISNSKQQELPPLSFTHLPSPYELELEEEYRNVFLQQNLDVLLDQQNLDVLLHQLQPLRATGATNLSQPGMNMVVSNDVADQLTEISNKKSDKPIIPTRRPSKKDRHSKIDTAQGPRDRRMRLSLKVARGFFDLQDKLGFDKASKTVEWLLTQAKDEIKKLTSSSHQMNSSSSVATKSASSTSEGEVLSKFKEASIEGSTSKGTCARKERRTNKPQPRKTTFAPLAKESREKARARARERTREKQRIQEHKLSQQNHNLNPSGYWTSSTFEIGEVSGSQSLDINPTSLDALAEVEQEQLDTPERIIDENFEVMGSWSSSFSNHLNINPAIPQELNQFTDFQAVYYNNNGMC